MPTLETSGDILSQMAESLVSSTFRSAGKYHTKDLVLQAATLVVKALARINSLTVGSSDWTDRTLYKSMETIDSIWRSIAESNRENYELLYPFPGYISVYKSGKLYDMITLQYEGIITTDNRTASYTSEPYGVNEFEVFQSTSLREISLETTFAATDAYLNSSHYVEHKIRKLQSLVYPGDLAEEQSPDLMTSNNATLIAPPTIGLFVGDKFMRSRLPSLTFNPNFDTPGFTASKYAIVDPLKPSWTSLLLETFGMLLMEPIYWKVISVNVEWSNSPTTLNFSEADVGFIPIPGNSKLPMYQKVTLGLKEFRPPHTFERDQDVKTLSSLNNVLGNLDNAAAGLGNK